jgi:hypothetical protein
MTVHDVKTLAVPEAGRVYFGIGKNAAYAAARRGDLPVIKIGGKLRVPVVALERLLAQAGTKTEQSDRVDLPNAR